MTRVPYIPRPCQALAIALTGAPLALALVFAPGRALAGTIGFKTDAKVSAGTTVDAEVTLTHTGDEAATDVQVDAEMFGKTVEGQKIPSIQPGQNHVWNFHLADQVPKGAYAIVLRAQYADANGYNFEIVSTASAPAGVTPAPKLFGGIDVPRLTVGGQAEGVLNVKKPAERGGTFDVEMIAPSGLEVTPRHLTLEFDDSGKATARFRIRNKDLLAGTSVNLFAFVTGSDPGFPQTDTIRGIARITAVETKVTSSQFYRMAGALAAVLALMEAMRWLRLRRRENA